MKTKLILLLMTLGVIFSAFGQKSVIEFTFSAVNNGLQSGIPDFPLSDEMYIFEYATNIPCPGMPTVTYEGQVYNTVQLFSQCWLKENLNAGTITRTMLPVCGA